MSDYLWDKTGEPEEDVERLEELLGQLRFQPKPLKLPAALPVRVARTRTSFTWSRAALAASLLLTLLAGAWLVLTKQRAGDAPPRMATNGKQQGDTTQQQQTQRSNQEAATSSQKGSAAPQVVRRERPRFVEAAKRSGAPRRHSNGRDVRAPQLATNNATGVKPLTKEEKEAIEKFVLAMRVTSEKLGYAERQIAGLSERSPQR